MPRRNNHEQIDLNKNTEWLGKNGFWSFYFLLILASRILIGVVFVGMGISDRYTWLIVHVGHTAATFIIMHWVKGSPFWLLEDQGRYDHLTFWEQIDDGRQYTRNRKVLTFIPVIISLLASYDTDWDMSIVFFNFIALLFVIIPKLGSLHRVRIGGINR